QSLGRHGARAHHRPAAAVRLVRRLGAARESRRGRRALSRERGQRRARGADAPALGDTFVKIMIAGGGTGGHVYPGIAVAEELMRIRPRAEVVFVGGKRGLEARAVPESGFRLRTIMVRGFPRRAWWRWPWAVVANIIGLAQALWVVTVERPDAVLGTGGYVSGPVSLAAWMLGRPLLLQEQNSIPGVANRWLARVADEVHLSFTEARTYFSRKDNLKVTGNPVRRHILGGDKSQGIQAF